MFAFPIQQLDEGFCAGWHNYWKSQFLTQATDEAIDVLSEVERGWRYKNRS